MREYLIKEAENLEVAKVIECYYRSVDEGREVRASELDAGSVGDGVR